MRFCSKCYLCKDESDFYKRKEDISGFGTRCKNCIDSVYYDKKSKNVKTIKTKGFENGVFVNRISQYNKDKYTLLKTAGRLPERKKYKIEYTDERKEKARQYYISNSCNIKIKCREYAKIRRKTDVLFKIKHNLRKRSHKFFERIKQNKKHSYSSLIGINSRQLKIYIERQFKKGMSWENYGIWHIDHIIPLSSAKVCEDIKTLCHYTNLQPLWAKDNIKKRAKILPTQMKIAI